MASVFNVCYFQKKLRGFFFVKFGNADVAIIFRIIVIFRNLAGAAGRIVIEVFNQVQ